MDRRQFATLALVAAPTAFGSELTELTDARRAMEISAGEVTKAVNDKKWVLVDTRTTDACGSGWRAAEVWTFAQVMGLSNTSLYSDGWIGWSNDPRNPVESGPIAAGISRRVVQPPGRGT